MLMLEMKMPLGSLGSDGLDDDDGPTIAIPRLPACTRTVHNANKWVAKVSGVIEWSE